MYIYTHLLNIMCYLSLVPRSQLICFLLYERGMVWYIAIVCLVLRATGSNAVFKY